MENWKSYNGYLVSDAGRIKNRNGTEKVLKIYKSETYQRASFMIEGKHKVIAIHRIVAELFLPNSKNLPCVNHINGIKGDNRAENLEWVSYSENMYHAVRSGLQPIGEFLPQSKLNPLKVRIIRKLLKEEIYTQRKIADLFNVSHGAIKEIKQGRNWRQVV